jgi:hypothetical protein
MRHFLAVGPLAISVAEPTITALLVPTAGLSHRLAPRFRAATPRAVPMTSIAATTEKEDLEAAGTDNEAKRIQATRGTSRKLASRGSAVRKPRRFHQPEET